MPFTESLPIIDPLLAKIAEVNSGNVSEIPDGPPNRVVTWNRGRTGYSLSLMLDDPGTDYLFRWHIWATAWRDDETKHIRKAIRPVEKFIYVPVDGPSLQHTLGEMIDEIRPKVPTLNLRGNPNVDNNIIISPLGSTT